MILQSLGDALWILLFFPLFLICAYRLLPGFSRLLGEERSYPQKAACLSRGRLGSLDAASTTLAATVGTGNIIGVAKSIHQILSHKAQENYKISTLGFDL